MRTLFEKKLHDKARETVKSGKIVLRLQTGLMFTTSGSLDVFGNRNQRL